MKQALTILCTAVFATVTLHAGGQPEKRITSPILYTEDRISFQFVTGALFSDTGIGPSIPDFNYQQNNFRIGWMLNTPSDSTPAWLRGNVEAILELSASAVMSGYGSYAVGPTALVRYNFVQPDWKVVPYIQGGAGIVLTDAYEEENQKAIGQFVEFTPQASAGARILVTDNISVDVEAMFHHISNASMASRNHGVNALGGFVGMTYFFDSLWQE
jgi:hypothetical protein